MFSIFSHHVFYYVLNTTAKWHIIQELYNNPSSIQYEFFSIVIQVQVFIILLLLWFFNLNRTIEDCFILLLLLLYTHHQVFAKLSAAGTVTHSAAHTNSTNKQTNKQVKKQMEAPQWTVNPLTERERPSKSTNWLGPSFSSVWTWRSEADEEVEGFHRRNGRRIVTTVPFTHVAFVPAWFFVDTPYGQPKLWSNADKSVRSKLLTSVGVDDEEEDDDDDGDGGSDASVYGRTGWCGALYVWINVGLMNLGWSLLAYFGMNYMLQTWSFELWGNLFDRLMCD